MATKIRTLIIKIIYCCCIQFISVSVLLSSPGTSLIVEGEINTKGDWAFIARFCYKDSLGTVRYYFEYPKKLCCQKAILYYDSQWSHVYPHKSKSCEMKLAVTKPENNQILLLSKKEYYSGCTEEKIDGEEKIVCRGGRQFISARSRWWYIVLANCGSSDGITIKYKMEMFNGDTFWTKHFSADERNVLQPNIMFLILYFILTGLGLLLASVLKSRQLFHYTYKLFLWSVAFELFSLLFDVIYYASYGRSGIPNRGLKVTEKGFHCLGDITFLVTLILLAKGWTVTRGRISSSGQVKLGVFCTLYSISYVALFIYEAKAFDPGLVLYLYESPAGVGLCIMRVVAWLWFCYGTFFTLKHYPTKYLFYYPFWFFYTLWFLSGPIFVLVATYILDAWIRAQAMNGIERTTSFVSHIFFVMLTRPSAANKNFPYHVRTSQVGIINTSESCDDFVQHPYAPTSQASSPAPETFDMSEKDFTDISSMFQAGNRNNTLQLGNPAGRTTKPLNNTDSGSTDSSSSNKQLFDGGPVEATNDYTIIGPKVQPNIGLFQASNAPQPM